MNGLSDKFVGAACVLALAGCSTLPPSGTIESKVLSATATVESIDQQTRIVTLRRAAGDSVTFRVDDNVKNLAQVSVGDRVIAQYHESVAFEVRRKGEAEPGVAVATQAETAELGEMPAGSGAQTITVTSTIHAIDKKTPAVTLKGPAGDLVTMKVRHPENLERVSVGDLVDITYTQAVAISVEKAPD